MKNVKENITPNFLKINSCTNPTTDKTLEYVNKRPCVMGLVLNPTNNKILMVNQYRVGADELVDEFVAGVIEEGQTPEEAMKAELLQEAGIKSEDILELSLVNKLYSSVGWTNELCYLYVITLKPDFEQIEQSLDEGENLTYCWKNVDEVVDDFIQNHSTKVYPAKTAFLIQFMFCSILQGQVAQLMHQVTNNSCSCGDSCSCDHEKNK